MRKKILLGGLVAVVGLGALAYVKRVDIVLALAASHKRTDIPENRSSAWMQGPAAAEATASDRPPNIIFILADDLGYNDISTFGGGLANGNIKTPNIDAFAASGVAIRQADSGPASCAPPRAMIITGR